MRVLLVWVAGALSWLAPASGQEQLRVNGPTPATVMLGSSARVDLVVEGRGADPEPPRPAAVPGLACQVLGPSRSSYSSITPRGVTEQVLTQYQLVLQPQREGTFEIPAFAWRTGTQVQTVPAIKLTAVKELRGAEYGYLEVAVAPQRVYVHEPIRVRVEFGVDKSLRPVTEVAQNRQRYFDFEVQAAWLSAMEGAEPLVEPESNGQTAPVVLNRTLLMAEYDGGHQRLGKAWNSFVFHKSFLPTRPGPLTLDAPLLRFQVQLREGRRGLFGETIGGQTQNYYVYGQPVEVEVLPIPEVGRPTPYYGAVGRFTLAAALDRDSVKVGGSVKLSLRLGGSGNFEFLRLPELGALEQHGLHLLGQTEDRRADSVTVTYDLTPLGTEVTAVPPIEWNYFDTTPGVERFATIATRELPLRALPPDNPEQLPPLPDTVRKAVTPGVDDIFDLPALLGAPRPLPVVTPWLPWLAVLLPWGVLLLLRTALLLQRRARSDPGAARGRTAARRCRRALDAGVAPLDAFAEYLADRLDVAAAAVIGPDLGARLAAAGVAEAVAASVAAAIDNGVAARYGGGGTLTAEHVRELVRQLEPVVLRRAAAARLLLATLAFGALAPLRAQESAAIDAYRAGDYAAAADAFARASERVDDRRLWFARGNCYYRLGDLPRARWAWECARLGMPRDAELAANLELVRRRLQLDGGGEAFAVAVAALRDRFTADELALLCLCCTTIAALGLGLGRGRAAWRAIGVAGAVPALLLAIELLWLRPARPARAIALQKVELVAEPRRGLQAVATVQPGVELELQGGDSGAWVRVAAEGRSGYAPRDQVAVVR